MGWKSRLATGTICKGGGGGGGGGKVLSIRSTLIHTTHQAFFQCIVFCVGVVPVTLG